MSIYVEILIRAPMDALWTHTLATAKHFPSFARVALAAVFAYQGVVPGERFSFACMNAEPPSRRNARKIRKSCLPVPALKNA
jgi:hypothetical protein